MIELNCSLTEDVIQHWQGPDDKYISDNNKTLAQNKEKYVIFGTFNLRILNFDFADAGTYKCEDSTNSKHPYSAQVIAIGKCPVYVVL